MDEKRSSVVLLVDDDESLINLSLRALADSSRSMEVHVARSLAEVRSLLAETSFELVIADLKLPDGRGTELLEQEGQAGRLPVVILIRLGDEREAVDAIKAGALDCVIKSPETLADLPRIAEHAFREWRNVIERKWGEAELQEASARNQRLIDSSQDIIWEAIVDGLPEVLAGLRSGELTVEQLADPDSPALTVKTTFVSPAVTDILGYTPEEAMARSYDEMYTPDSIQRCYQLLYDGLAAEAAGNPLGPVTAELEEIAKDGSIVNMEMKCQFIRNEVGDPIGAAGTSRDITERKEAERAIEASEPRFRTLVESAPDAIVIVDSARIIQLVNAQTERLFGYSSAELVGQTLELLVPPAQRETHVEHCASYFASPRITPMGRSREFAGLHKDGTEIPVDISLSPIETENGLLVVAAIRDITARKHAETALQESEDLYRTLVEVLPQSIFRKDLEGRVTFANQQCCDSLGRTVNEVLGKTDLELVPADLATKYREDDRRVMETGELLDTVEDFVGSDGQRQCVRVVKTPLRNADGQVVGLQGIFWDITERVREQEALREANLNLEQTLAELKQAQDQVVQQERLRAVGQMASGAAHDLNNALSPVLGYADLLGSDPQLSQQARDWVKLIRTGASDAVAVVDRLRQFYGVEETVQSMAAVNLGDVLRQLPELTRPKWHDEAMQTGREITIHLDIDEAPPVNGVEADLRQVFANLLLNAVDALPAGGRIVLRLRSTHDSVIVEVTDNGIGMTEDERRRCFDPFFTTKRDGSGLGLSVCHGILQRHNGWFEVDSAPAHGTTFRLHFPALNIQDCQDTVTASSTRAIVPRRILYIDDDERLRPLVASILKQLDQVVDVAEDGVSGLTMLKQDGYDVVITDLGMSDMDGRQVTRTIRESWPTMPVIMLSGWSEEVALQDADALELPTVFLQKPPTLGKVREALDRITESF